MKAAEILYLRTLGKLFVAVGLLCALLLALSIAFPISASGSATCANHDDHGNCTVWVCTLSIEQCIEDAQS